jgi:threonyl-tRNA synthetase
MNTQILEIEKMPIITLPDGSQKKFEQAVTVAEVAQSIGAGLAKAALAGLVNDRLVDTSFVINEDAKLSIITEKNPQGLEVIRHSTAHLLAHAVKELFPAAQVTIGPVIEDGFYYDFAFPQGFTPDDLIKIETKMQELAKQNIPVIRSVMQRQEAIKFFRDMGEEYKAKIIEEIPEGEELSVYKQGNFIDLCRGPHVPNTSMLKAFKLTKVSGAYWRGDSKNEMLQRIYGTAWPDKKALDEYLLRIEEAEKRDHRKIAKKMDLFHQQEEAPGMIFWHGNGWTIYQTMLQYMREKLRAWDYEEVNTPQILNRQFWEKSGHWEKFQEEMFITESEKNHFAVKPMSCPGHVQIFKQALHSYRDLPYRFAEFGSCHRNEPSGSLHGLMRVRHFTQDDGHIFCTEDQIAGEIEQFIQQLKGVYADFGFDQVLIKLSTRPPKRVGSEEIWDKAEAALEQVLNAAGVEWKLQPGDGAFYGPKIEFVLKDCLGRFWTCGTIQLDFSMPERLGAHYIAEDSSKRTPVMLHRAILGTFERFMGILLEHYAGDLPLWLSPVQVMVMNITDQQAEYTAEMAETLKNLHVRARSDLRNEKIGFKIREHSMQRIPYLLVVGDREMAQKQVAVRTRKGEDLGVMSLQDFNSRIQLEIKEYR